MRHFIPPLNDPVSTSIAKALVPLALKKEKLDLRPSPNCLDSLKSLRDKNCVIMVNHSDRFDPLVMFSLSKYAGEAFHYLAARELFDKTFGLDGFVLQHLGAYSVIRGQEEDEASKESTISIVVSGERKLVEFPEGDVSGRDDEVLPLKADGVRNLVAAQRKVRRMNPDKTVYVLPMALYYQAHNDALSELLDRTTAIEQALSIRRRETKQTGMAQLHIRLAYVIEALINSVEQRYGAETVANGHLNSRLLRICRRIVTSVAANFALHLKNTESEAEMLYSLRAQLRKFYAEDLSQWGGYSTKLRAELKRKAKEVQVDLDRVQQLLILESTMRQQPVNLDVAWRIVDRLELEVLGSARPKGHRTAWIDVGPPIDLSTYVGEHDWNERIVQRLADDVRNAIFFRLQRTKKEHQNSPASAELARSV